MPLTFADTLSGRQTPVRPRPGRPLALYVCGPTVNDRAHLGHGRTYLYFDLVRRYYRDRGVRVRHVMNITDFEDKITERAIRLDLSWRSLARREERRFKSDLLGLKILPPHLQPRASSFVPAMIRLIQRLERKNRIHREGDSWFYRTTTPHDPRNFPIGAELSRHAVPEPGQPIEALDLVNREFLVWRQQLPPAASWNSPWGRGAPGWHLECFTMAERHLGIPVDIHGGGQDLIFPHHYAENEIALTLGGTLFSRHFLHTAFVTENGKKLSKSAGNLAPLRGALTDFGPDALRMYLRAPPRAVRLDWRRNDLEKVASRFADLRQLSRGSLAGGAGGSLDVRQLEGVTRRIRTHLEQGFRVERAIEEIWRWGDVLGGAYRGAFARGDRRRAAGEYARLEQLTGVALV